VKIVLIIQTHPPCMKTEDPENVYSSSKLAEIKNIKPCLEIINSIANDKCFYVLKSYFGKIFMSQKNQGLAKNIKKMF